MFPTLFISHGSPELAVMKHEVSDFLGTLPTQIKKPKSIIIVSAHWVSKDLQILANPHPGLIYDFYGFPRELYEKKYDAHNDMELVGRLRDTLSAEGFDVSLDTHREGYDHGVWTILSLIYPQADIPVVQLSLPMSYTPEQLSELGRALGKFRGESLIIGSGNMTHNLRGVRWNAPAGYVERSAREFRDYVVERIEEGDAKSLTDIASIPYLMENHPTIEHLLPLFVVMGASQTHRGESLIENYMYGNLAMDTIIFKE